MLETVEVDADQRHPSAPRRTVAKARLSLLLEQSAVRQAGQRVEPPTHVFLQAGVGGFAAAVAGHLAIIRGRARPTIIVVEPARAACVFASAKAGRLVKIPHGAPTVMAMLECCEPSLVAWRILSRTADAFMTVDEEDAVAVMNRLARPAGDDPAVVAGESGGAGLAGLIRVAADAAARTALGLLPDSRVLIVNTEGATDPEKYLELVGLTPDAGPHRRQGGRMTGISIDGERLLGRIRELGVVGRGAPAG